MVARVSVTQERAAYAEDVQDLWRAIWADGEITEEEREEMGRRLAANVTHWSEQTRELAFVAAFVGGGIPATRNRNARVSKLAREALTDGHDFLQGLDQPEPLPALGDGE